MKFRFYLRVIFSLLGFGFFGQASAQINSNTIHDVRLLLQEKESRTPAQQKIDSRLLQAIRERSGQPMVSGVSLQPAKVLVTAGGLAKVDVETGNANVDAVTVQIEDLGGKILYASFTYHTIRAAINFSKVETLAGFSEVKFIKPAVESHIVGEGLSSNLNKKKWCNRQKVGCLFCSRRCWV